MMHTHVGPRNASPYSVRYGVYGATYLSGVRSQIIDSSSFSNAGDSVRRGYPDMWMRPSRDVDVVFGDHLQTLLQPCCSIEPCVSEYMPPIANQVGILFADYIPVAAMSRDRPIRTACAAHMHQVLEDDGLCRRLNAL